MDWNIRIFEALRSKPGGTRQPTARRLRLVHIGACISAETRWAKAIHIWEEACSSLFCKRDRVAPAAAGTALEAFTATWTLLLTSSAALRIVPRIHHISFHTSVPA
jgi:hypothetical protein